MPPNHWLEINLTRLEANVRWWRFILDHPSDRHSVAAQAAAAALPDDGAENSGDDRASMAAPPPAAARPSLCTVVKADAYGLGAAAIVPRLCRSRTDMLAVYSPDEAARIVDAAGQTPILVFMPAAELGEHAPTRLALAQGRLQLSVHDLASLEQAHRMARSLGHVVRVHLHVDTGMSRGGLSPREFAAVLGQLPRLSRIAAVGIYTHLACSDDNPASVDHQMAQLDHLLQLNARQLPAGCKVHAAATFAALRSSRHHRDMVRVGLGLYGYSSELMTNGTVLKAPGRPLPITRWLSRVVHLQHYKAGTFVGYGATHKLARDSRLALVPAGYAAGYPRHLSNRASVRLLNEHDRPIATCPMLGLVNMDQIVIDVTDVPQAALQTTVELYSDDPTAPNALPQLAKLAGTHCYEMLCRLATVPRVYVERPETPTVDSQPALATRA